MASKPKELTHSACQNAKPREKPWKLHDVRGLFLLVNPNGSKWWRLRYTWLGKDALMSLGVFPDVSLAQAREARDKSRGLIASGINPAKAKQDSKREARDGSFGAMFAEWFEVHRPDWADANIRKILRMADGDLLPWLKDRPVKEIDAPEVLAVLRRVESRSPETARRVCQIVSQVYVLAIGSGRASHNPAASLAKLLKKPVSEKRAAITNPDEVGAMVRAFAHYSGGLVVKTALHLSALTWVRPGELRQAEWADIDFDKAEWRVRVETRKLTKVKKRTAEAHLVPLSAQAVAHLRTLQPLTGSGRFVFPNERTRQKPMSDGAVNVALRTLGIAKESMCAHGFRATASTLLNEMGWNPDAIERQLAHVETNKVRDAYNRSQYEAERRRMMQAWADYLDSLAAGQSKVVPLRSA